MTETILQIFLNNKFIKTSDAGNIESLNKAVTALKTYLGKKKHLIIPYTLIALDPLVDEINPAVSEVEAIIIKTWPTFKNSTSTKDKPTTYVRVVILQALSELAKSDEEIGGIIWLTGRNVISYYQVQKEQESLSSLIVNMGNAFENESRKIWSVNTPVITDIKKLNVGTTAKTSTKVNQVELLALLKAASIHSGWSSQGGGGENPSHPSAGNWEWAKYFSERAAPGLAEIFDKALLEQNTAIANLTNTIEKDISEYFSQFTAFFLAASKSFNQSAEAANKRSELLWWKQTLYSPSLNDSYRNLKPIQMAITMANDLSLLIGTIYPESANYLLREALRDIHQDLEKKETFSFWLKQSLEFCDPSFKTLDSLKTILPGRISLGSAFANAINEGSENGFLAQTGLDPNHEVSLSDLVVWLLHDLQAVKISNQK